MKNQFEPNHGTITLLSESTADVFLIGRLSVKFPRAPVISVGKGMKEIVIDLDELLEAAAK